MLRFENPEHLYLLIGIPILLIFFAFVMMLRKRTIQQLGNDHIIKQLMPSKSKYRHLIKFAILIVAFAFLCIAYANPQQGSKREKVKRKSADIFIALDVSHSMLAQDIRPNRMERAKQFMHKLISGLKGERVGTIIFAGNAYLQMPLTTDYSATQLFIKSASPKMVPSQGTAIGEAINMAYDAFEEDNKFHKALIIITDGENHDEAALELAKEVGEEGMLIFTVGVGTPAGGPIPHNTLKSSGYKKDKAGNIVISNLNEVMLTQLASAANGEYYNIAEGNEIIESLAKRIDKLEKQEFEQRSFTEFESYFQYFLAIAILLLIIEFMMAYRRNETRKKRDLFKI